MTKRLISTLVANWEQFDGYAVAHGMPPLYKVPLNRLCSFVYWRLTDGADEEALHRFRVDLWMPTAEDVPTEDEVLDSRSPWNPENERAALGGLKTALGLKE